MSQKLKRDEILSFAIKSGKIRFDEQICENFDWKDFDDDKFQYYLKLAQISGVLGSKDILMNLNLLRKEGVTNAGVLLFAKHPALFSIGFTLVVGVFAGYLTSMLVVPALYALFGKDLN